MSENDDLSALPEWHALAAHHRTLAASTLAGLFASDPDRFAALSRDAEGIFVDFSKQHWTAETLRLLAALAERRNLRGWIDAMFRGERVNLTEGRAALHTVLRQSGDAPLRVDGVDVVAQVRAAQSRMAAIATEIREGRWHGATGRPIRQLVNIGIGGSDLGPLLACAALAPASPGGPGVHFVSNVDPAHFEDTVASLDAGETAFLVTSKTFTTDETLRNARAARRWLSARLGEGAEVSRHLLAATAHPQRAREFGAASDNVLPFWDWVGGRYSLWSAVGLPVAVAIGWEGFARMLDGARSVDDHFRGTPYDRNLPVMMGLLTIWNADFHGRRQSLLAPYSQRLARLPAYVQQLSLESNGKRVTRAGRPVAAGTAPAIWGEPGTNAQHAYFQWVHQGTDVVPVEFVVAARPSPGGDAEQHRVLVANALAQAQALLAGKTESRVRDELTASGATAGDLDAQAPHRAFPGNRPSTTIVLPELDAFRLGQLIALYEHRTFVEAVIWGINPFDQFGVELGKRLMGPVLAALGNGEMASGFDPSTAGLVARVRTAGG